MSTHLSDATSAGFYMPAEWQPHERCWMAWPCRSGFNSEATRDNYAQVARAIARFEPVTMVVHPRDRAMAEAALGEGIDCLEIPIDDGWFRDNGPNFLINDAGDLRRRIVNHIKAAAIRVSGKVGSGERNRGCAVDKRARCRALAHHRGRVAVVIHQR